MKKIITSVFSLMLISMATFAQTPTAEAIIDNYTKAIGGKDAIAKIQDITITMTGEVQGMSIETVSQKKNQGKLLMTVNVSGMGEMQKIQCDGKKARIVAQGNVTDVPDKDLKSLLATQVPIFPEMNYVASGVTLKVAGTEKLDGKDAYKIEASLGDDKWTEYFDVTSGYKVRQVMTKDTPMGQQTVTLSFDEFTDYSGVKFSKKISQDMGMMKIDLSVSKIEVNKNLADSVFDIN